MYIMRKICMNFKFCTKTLYWVSHVIFEAPLYSLTLKEWVIYVIYLEGSLCALTASLKSASTVSHCSCHYSLCFSTLSCKVVEVLNLTVDLRWIVKWICEAKLHCSAGMAWETPNVIRITYQLKNWELKRKRDPMWWKGMDAHCGTKGLSRGQRHQRPMWELVQFLHSPLLAQLSASAVRAAVWHPW